MLETTCIGCGSRNWWPHCDCKNKPQAQKATREGEVEKYLHARVAALGGEHRRFKYSGRRHANDDLILLSGRHLLVECKRPGKSATDGQAREHERLRKAGFEVHVVSTKAEIDVILPLN